jgi:hypothetical protein
MNKQEVAAALGKVQAFDNRNVTEATVLAWAEALADITLAEALAAITEHFKTSDAWLMPSHIRTIVKRDRPWRGSASGAISGPPADLAKVRELRAAAGIPYKGDGWTARRSRARELPKPAPKELEA